MGIDPITQYIIEASNLRILLGDFDQDFWNSLPKDKEKMFFNSKRSFYHTMLLNDKTKVGIAGVILNPKHKEFGFFQIYIVKSYRGKNLLLQAAKLIFKKYKLKSLIATIKKNNQASIKAHLKIGFIPVDEIKHADIIERGYQKKDEIRLIYHGVK